MKINSLLLWLTCSLAISPVALPAAELPAPALSSDFEAILRTGDVRQIREALDRGASPNARDEQGNTPLMLAAVYGEAGAVRLLLDRGAEVNAANAAGATALLHAAADHRKVSLLVARGADVNHRSEFGNTALMLAARAAKSHRTVELLLSRGADAKATNGWGSTALMAAAAAGDAASVRSLLQHGADPNAQPALSEGGFIFGGGRSALMWAAYRGDLTILRRLLDAGADVNGEGPVGTPLSQAAWGDKTEAAKLLIARGARVNQVAHRDGYTALHWAASTEGRDPGLVKLLLQNHADPNAGGGENIDAFVGTLQTPLMLAQHRGETAVVTALEEAGATNVSSSRAPTPAAVPPTHTLPAQVDLNTLRAAVAQAIAPLQRTSLESKASFVSHASHQDCTSCHQQHLPLAAIGAAKKIQAPVDSQAEHDLVSMMQQGELKNPELDWQPLFHPDPAQTKGYTLFGYAMDAVPADAYTDSWVHHLCAIQGPDGEWYNNLPRPPIQTGDIGATALAVHALQHYPLPGRKAEFTQRVEHARAWLWNARPENTEGRIYQLLGLAWSGVPARKLQTLAQALRAEQRADGGWAQLPKKDSDAYATSQAVFALCVAAGASSSDPSIERGRRFLLSTQLEDGTWHVRRRAFPFQPTMKSGFPHGRDSWISAAATSWAVLALGASAPAESPATVTRRAARR
jgi:ankyrin repeat protein